MLCMKSNEQRYNSAVVYIHPSLEGENPSGWLEPNMTNIEISLTDINVDPNDGVKTNIFLAF